MLSSFQKKVSAAAITCVSVSVIFAFAIGTLLLLAKFLNTFSAVVWPLALAAILSIILKPSVNFISKKLKISMLWSSAIVFAVLTLALVVIALTAIPAMASQIMGIASEIPDLARRFALFLSERFPHLKDTLSQQISEIQNIDISKSTLNATWKALQKLSSTAISATSGLVGACSFIAAFAVAPIYLFYMLISKVDYFAILERQTFLMSASAREDLMFFVKRFCEILESFFRGQLLIALIMGTLLGSGLYLSGVKFGFLLGFSAGMLNIIPYFGTMVGLGTILPTAFLQTGGGIILSAIALAVFLAVQLIEAYVLTPKIMGNRTGLHPTVIIFSVFFWGIALNGILGMILAIPLSAFAAAAWARIKERNSKHANAS